MNWLQVLYPFSVFSPREQYFRQLFVDRWAFMEVQENFWHLIGTTRTKKASLKPFKRVRGIIWFYLYHPIPRWHSPVPRENLARDFPKEEQKNIWVSTQLCQQGEWNPATQAHFSLHPKHRVCTTAVGDKKRLGEWQVGLWESIKGTWVPPWTLWGGYPRATGDASSVDILMADGHPWLCCGPLLLHTPNGGISELW